MITPIHRYFIKVVLLIAVVLVSAGQPAIAAWGENHLQKATVSGGHGGLAQLFPDGRAPASKNTVEQDPKCSPRPPIRTLMRGTAYAKVANGNTRREGGASALHVVAARNNTQLVKHLLDLGEDPDVKDFRQRTPLHYAAEQGHVDAIKSLLGGGAHVDARDNVGETPLHYASKRGHLGAIETLLEGGAHVNTGDKVLTTPLHYAAARGDTEAMKILLGAGADVNARGPGGRLPLHCAAEGHQVNAVEILLAAGSRVNATCRARMTPLHYACQRGSVEVANRLILAGADVYAENGEGTTPLHSAAAHGRVYLIKALLAAGADVNAESPYLGTALHLAAKGGFLDAVETLVTAGANVDAEDISSMTPAQWGTLRGHDEVARILQLHGKARTARHFGTRRGRTIGWKTSRDKNPNQDEIAEKARNYKALATKGVNVFGVKMYLTLQRGDEGLVCSPLSAFATLGIAYAGARGITRSEMADILGLNEVRVPLHVTLCGLTRDLKGSKRRDGPQLQVANGLWVHEWPSTRIRREFEETVTTCYKVMIAQADFHRSPDKVSLHINNWVHKATHGRITDIATPEDFHQAVLSIVNAVYFKGKWKQQFKTSETRDFDFTLLDGSRIRVRMMTNRSMYYKYGEQPGFQVLELPYKGSPISMVAFLPRRPDGLREMEESLTAEKLARWLGDLSMQPNGVEVYLPKFKIRSRLKLVPTLKSMGLASPFNRDTANLSGILEKKGPAYADLPNLFLSCFRQEACLSVTEAGTEAAAATIAMASVSGGLEPKVFRADHPFMFMIYHRPTKCILFMGRVTRPEPSRSDDRSWTR